MRLVLLGNGSTDAVRSAAFPGDEPLDRHGVARCRAVRPAVPRSDDVRCAPERRCRETAAELGLTPCVDPGLRGPAYGTWSGLSLDDVAAADPAGLHGWTTDPGFRGHGGESLAELAGRIGRWLDDRRDPPHATFAVCDPAVVRAAVVHALGAPPEAIWRVDVAPLTAAVLVGGPGRWGLRGLEALGPA